MNADALQIESNEGGVSFYVKALPGSRDNSIRGIIDGKLKISVTAPPEKGKANKAIVELLAKRLGIRPKNIKIVSGQINEIKLVEISGVDATFICRISQ